MIELQTKPTLPIHGVSRCPSINFFNVDCIEFMKSKPDKCYDLAIIDPPYRDSNQPTKQMRDKKAGKMDKFGLKPTAEYWNELFRISDNQIVWGANNFIEHLKNTNCFVFWDKVQVMENYSDGELAWTSFNKPAKLVQYVWSGNRYGTIGNIKGVGEPTCRFHPTQKPEFIYRWLLSNFGKKGDKILDTHGGSMSIAIACEIEGFDLDICEIDSEYFKNGVDAFNMHKRQQRLF